jgi:hypothetical protein
MTSSGRREQGFDRIGRTTRYFAVGAIVAGGVLSAAAAKALPGKSTHHSNGPTAASGAGAGAGSGVSDSGSAASGSGVTPISPIQSDPSLNQPTQAPQPSYSAPVATSGGS